MPAAPRLIAALADRYAFEGELGQGGMATVYLADDLRHHRKVAIKVLRPELAATIGPDRFFREIRIAAQLQHPHILPLLESGEAEGFLFYVMPFVDGQSLRDRLAKTGELPVHEAVKLLAEIVDALSYAHARGVVHRDVKPDNVMLSGRHALVMDFGVAKAVSEASGRNQLTTAGVALGTPAYMAPEQAAADPNLDHRVDIYAVGAMAYELLAGRPPFVGGTPQQVLAAHVTQTPDPVTRYRPGLSAALEAVIMRCLAKRPADRFQSADELLAQLEPLVTPSGGMTPTTTRPIEGWRPERGRRFWPVLAAAAVVGIAALSWAMRPRESEAKPLQVDQTQLTFTGNVHAPSLSTDGRRIAFAERRCDSTGLCKFDILVKDVAGAGSAVLARDAINAWGTDWTGDDRYIVIDASFDEDWGCYSIPVLGGQRRHLGRGACAQLGNGDTTLITWANPGDTLAWIRRVGTATGVIHDSVSIPIAGDAFPVVKPTSDGRWLIIGEWRGRGSTITIANRAGEVRDSLVSQVAGYWTFDPVPGSDTFIGLSGDIAGRSLATLLRHRIDDDGTIGPADTLIRQIDSDRIMISRNGDLLISSGPRETAVYAFTWDGRSTASMRMQRLARMTSVQVTGSISNDGRQLFLVRDQGIDGSEQRQMSLMPFDSGPERIMGSPAQALDWDWGAPDIYIATRAGDSVDVGILDLATGRIRKRRSFPGQEYAWLEGIPTGGAVVASTLGRQLHLIDRPGLRDTTIAPPAHAGVIFSAEPSPDGKELATVGWLPGEDSLGVHIFRLADGSMRRVAVLFGENLETPRWLPDGKLLVPLQETRWTEALYRVSPTGGDPERLGTLPLMTASYRFSADGRRGIIRAFEQNTDVHVVRGFAPMVNARP